MNELQGLADNISEATLLQLLRTMLRIRRFEEVIVEVYGEQDMKTPVHLCVGQEAIAAGICAHLRKDDYLITTHRGHGHCLAKGAKPFDLYAEFYGRDAGCCHGKGGSMHPAAPEVGVLGASAIVGGTIPLAAGAGLAIKFRKGDQVSVGFFGDGASEEGTFQESLSFASLKKLPVIFVCENNSYAVNSNIAARQPHDDICRRGEAFGMHAVQLDGNDVIAVYSAAAKAIEQARRGEGPALLECRTYRWHGHVGPEFDHKQGCRPEEELLQWMERDPLKIYFDWLCKKGIIDEATYRKWVDEINHELRTAIVQAKASPLPAGEDVTKHVYYCSGQGT